MPALDELLLVEAQERVDIFESREVQAGELGVKYAPGGVGMTVDAFYTKLRNITSQGAEVDPVTGRTRWVLRLAPENRSYGVEVEAFVTPAKGLQLFGSGTFLEAEMGSGIDSLVGRRLELAPTTIGNLVAIYSPHWVSDLQVKADWHWVGSRFTESPLTRIDDTKLPSYGYFNLGLAYAIRNAGIRINADLLNASQSKGLEEGNPRLVAAGERALFLARPLLPRRFQASIEYDIGRREAQH